MPDSPHLLLGFDFGMKRIGVAVGQTLTGHAKPLDILPARDGIPDWATIEALIKKWQPQALVVGIPINMDGTDMELTNCAKRFANRLQEWHKLPVHRVDERLSTVAAREQVIEAGKKLDRLDAVAAKVILEQYINQSSE